MDLLFSKRKREDRVVLDLFSRVEKVRLHDILPDHHLPLSINEKIKVHDPLHQKEAVFSKISGTPPQDIPPQVWQALCLVKGSRFATVHRGLHLPKRIKTLHQDIRVVVLSSNRSLHNYLSLNQAYAIPREVHLPENSKRRVRDTLRVHRLLENK